MPQGQQNLVDRISQYIMKHTDTNPDFADLCACVCVSTAVGKNVYISNKLGDLDLNIFGLVIGGSGVSNKTLAIRITRQIIRVLSRELYPNLNEQHGMLAPVKFTTEAMTKWFNDKLRAMQDYQDGNTVPECAAIGDEYTKMFMGSKTRDYLATTLEYLSTLYDGYVDKTATIARGVEEVEKVYFNFLSATTFYILKLMGPEFFTQGNGTRILFVFDDQQEEVTPTQQEIDSFFANFDRQRTQQIEFKSIVNDLARLHRMVVTATNGMIIPQIDAMRLMSRYRFDKKNESIHLYKRDMLNPDANYISRLAQNSMKLAGIRCVSRYYNHDYWDEAMVMLELEDAEWAISKVERYYKSYIKIRDAIALVSTEQASPSMLQDHQRIINAVKKFGGFATISQLLNATRWKSTDLQRTLTDMVEAGILIEDMARTTGGRPAKTYKLAANRV